MADYEWAVDERSAEALDHLASDLREGGVLALAGAGISKGAGFPTWDELLAAMEQASRSKEAVGSEQHAGTDVLWRAESCRRKLGTDYSGFLRNTFRALPKVTPTIRLLVELPFSHILTTNYDRSLQHAHQTYIGNDFEEPDWMDRAEMRKFLFTFHRPGKPRCYVHLHGRCENPESMVLSHGDYVKRYTASDDAAQRLLILFATHRVAFIGFSLSDPALTYVLERVNSRLAVGDAKHYVLLPGKSVEHARYERERLRTMYGIDPIFYRNEDGGHSNLESALQALTGKVTSPAGTVPSLESDLTAGKRVDSDATRYVHPTERPIIREDDLQKGRFGGLAERNGRRLSAQVTRSGEDWYRIHLKVQGSLANPLLGLVEFHLHHTFNEPVEKVRVNPADGGRAELTLHSYGAFTVGALADDGKTELELDLATLEDAPLKFRRS